MDNVKSKLFASALIVLAIFNVIGLFSLFGGRGLVGSSNQRGPTFLVASSTTFTVTTSSSLRLLATSTTRVAADIQTHFCATGSNLFLNAQSDQAATANNGRVVLASSTASYATYPSADPVPQGAVQGITGVGTCTVLVTEWRTQYQ